MPESPEWHRYPVCEVLDCPHHGTRHFPLTHLTLNIAAQRAEKLARARELATSYRNGTLSATAAMDTIAATVLGEDKP